MSLYECLALGTYVYWSEVDIAPRFESKVVPPKFVFGCSVIYLSTCVSVSGSSPLLCGSPAPMWEYSTLLSVKFASVD